MRKKTILLLLMILSLYGCNSAEELPVEVPINNNSETNQTEIKSNFSIGDTILLGTYLGEPITWRCVDIDENGALMLSDKILCLKAFDASGDNFSGSHSSGNANGKSRKNNGSNYWADSNIRCWLNSNEQNVSWSCGNPPNAENIESGINPYESESGFLCNFSDEEKSKIKKVKQKNVLSKFDDYTDGSEAFDFKFELDSYDLINNYDNAYCEYIEDNFFLLDVKQLTAIYDNRSILGERYHIGTLSSQCVKNFKPQTESEYFEYKENGEWNTWTRTPCTTADCTVLSQSKTYYFNHVTDSMNGYHDLVTGEMANTSLGIRPAFYYNE